MRIENYIRRIWELEKESRILGDKIEEEIRTEKIPPPLTDAQKAQILFRRWLKITKERSSPEMHKLHNDTRLFLLSLNL